MNTNEDRTSEETQVDLPLVSVIIPCYNHGNYLEESVKSILDQTYKNIEIILVDDGSTDSSKFIAKNLQDQNPNRISYISFPKNHGKWYALNTAISKSKGELITCHDADDWSYPNRIERQVLALQATGALHCLCSFHHCFSQQEMDSLKMEETTGDLKGIEASVVSQMVEYGASTPEINHYFTGEIETAGTSAMYYKAVWDRGIRFNPPDMGLRIAMSEDSDFNQRVTLLLKNTVLLAEKLYLYRRHTSTNVEKM